MSSTTNPTGSFRSRFTTVVPTVKRFPLPILILGALLLLVNIGGFINALLSIQTLAPSLSPADAQIIGAAFAARQAGVAIVFALALFGKNVRFLQLAWGIAAIREIGDFPMSLALGGAFGAIAIGVLILVEIGTVIYLGAIASGHVAKYKAGSMSGQ